MIISKPKNSTLTSIGLFLLLVFGLAGATFISIKNSDVVYWYHYLFLAILLPVGVGLLIKMILSYKIITIGKGKMHVKFPARFSQKNYSINNIKQWQEVKIKTVSGLYQQLEIIFNDNDKLTLSKQEHTFYDQVMTYLHQKVAKKKIT
jgi:hypothetical protein